ncbi:MAG: hypothetical protein U0L51_00620 [Olegusella sp.]|nr:hypothetical protein [Olegusella sp.]
MTPIYPSTALKNEQREIKALADQQPVYITENGRGKYVFVSEEVMEREMARRVEDALYEYRVTLALRESRDDIAAGKTYSTREELRSAVARKRASRG